MHAVETGGVSTDDDDVERAIRLSLEDQRPSAPTNTAPTNGSSHAPVAQGMAALGASASVPILGDERFQSLATAGAEASRALAPNDDFDAQMKQAIALSLQDAPRGGNSDGSVLGADGTGAAATDRGFGDMQQSLGALLPGGGGNEATVHFYHYNGLRPPYAQEQPAQPLAVEIDLDGLGVSDADVQSPVEQANRARKIQSVISRHRIAGSDAHEYLVACARDGSMEFGDVSLQEHAETHHMCYRLC